MDKMDKMELQKMDFEDRQMCETIESYKNAFIDEIKTVNRHNKEFYLGSSVKYKKPFKVRFNEFKEKLRKVLGA